MSTCSDATSAQLVECDACNGIGSIYAGGLLQRMQCLACGGTGAIARQVAQQLASQPSPSPAVPNASPKVAAGEGASLAFEYATTSCNISSTLNVRAPIQPDGRGWEMCGSAAMGYAQDRLNERAALFWFWRRPMP